MVVKEQLKAKEEEHEKAMEVKQEQLREASAALKQTDMIIIQQLKAKDEAEAKALADLELARAKAESDAREASERARVLEEQLKTKEEEQSSDRVEEDKRAGLDLIIMDLEAAREKAESEAQEASGRAHGSLNTIFGLAMPIPR